MGERSRKSCWSYFKRTRARLRISPGLRPKRRRSALRTISPPSLPANPPAQRRLQRPRYRCLDRLLSFEIAVEREKDGALVVCCCAPQRWSSLPRCPLTLVEPLPSPRPKPRPNTLALLHRKSAARMSLKSTSSTAVRRLMTEYKQLTSAGPSSVWSVVLVPSYPGLTRSRMALRSTGAPEGLFTAGRSIFIVEKKLQKADRLSDLCCAGTPPRPDLRSPTSSPSFPSQPDPDLDSRLAVQLLRVGGSHSGS